MKLHLINSDKGPVQPSHAVVALTAACRHCAEKPQCRKPQFRMPQCRKATVQKDTVQNGRSAEMGNVPIVLSSRVKLALCNY